MDKCMVRSHWKLQPILHQLPGERDCLGSASLNHFMAHQLRAWEKGVVPAYLCRFGLVMVPQLTNFSMIKQMSWVYICAWGLCIHLCVYRSICVCVYGYTYLFPSLFTLVG